MIIRHRVALATCLLCMLACGGLPSDFEDLTLEGKISAYEKHFSHLGGPLMRARSHISWYGLNAAERMLPYLDGSDSDLPRIEAIEIIHFIQLRGCSLAGSDVEVALKQLENTKDLTDAEIMVLGETLLSIKENRTDKNLDGLSGGPCAAE